MFSLLGAAAGIALLYVAVLVGQPIMSREFGLHIPVELPALEDLWIIGAVVLAGGVAGSIPAMRAYRLSLADGLSIRN